MVTDPARPAVPPLPAEDHLCHACRLDYVTLAVADALGLIEQLPEQVRSAVGAVPRDRLRRRPDPGTWSVIEYLCHLRDVAATSTIRLHRVRTEDRPVLEPMLNDLRARRFRYVEHDPGAVLDELAWNVRGLLDEARRVTDDGWGRVATRLPGEERSARWLVRQAAHEGRHHVGDIVAVDRALGSVV
jgi:hypothetical protein